MATAKEWYNIAKKKIDCVWCAGEVPESMKITQVYGITFSQDGRILLQIKIREGKKIYSLSGGKPESFDKDMVATLRRETIEEVNTTLGDKIFMAGYQRVDENNGKPAYAQVRMVALIDKIGPRQVDPANGEIYERILVSPERAIELLSWGESGKMQIKDGYKIAQEKFKIKTTNFKDEYV